MKCHQIDKKFMLKNIFKRIIIFALKTEAKFILRKHKPKIIAITGTVGKTSVKDAVALIVGRKFKIRKSEKSYNSKLGVPLTVIGAKNAWSNPFQWLIIFIKGLKEVFSRGDYPEWLVLEAGIDEKGGMRRFISWIEPNIAVVTALGEVPVHVENFKSPEDLMKEKMKLAHKIAQENYIVLNGDDKFILANNGDIKANVVKFGFEEGNDVKISNYRITPEGINFKIDYKGNIIPVRLNNIFGRQFAYIAAAAMSVGLCLGFNLIEMVEDLLLFKPQPGRLNLLEGIKNSLIFDDSYNSSPMAVASALGVLKDFPSKRKIVVLGDMLELGKFAIEEHRKVGKAVNDLGADFFFAVGPRMKFAAEEARVNGFNPKNIFEFSTSEETKSKVQEIIKEGDLVLVKGSQSMRMEKVTEEIMAHPENKNELLVRQEKEWLNR